MSEIKDIELKNKSGNTVYFKLPESSAIKQRELMALLGGKIILHTTRSGSKDINTDFLKGVLITESLSGIEKIDSLTLSQCHNADGNIVDLKTDFQSNMNMYFDLLVEAVKLNLGDFFSWLDSGPLEDETKEMTNTKGL